jgi:hypothetical protein
MHEGYSYTVCWWVPTVVCDMHAQGSCSPPCCTQSACRVQTRQETAAASARAAGSPSDQAVQLRLLAGSAHAGQTTPGAGLTQRRAGLSGDTCRDRRECAIDSITIESKCCARPLGGHRILSLWQPSLLYAQHTGSACLDVRMQQDAV